MDLEHVYNLMHVCTVEVYVCVVEAQSVLKYYFTSRVSRKGYCVTLCRKNKGFNESFKTDLNVYQVLFYLQ